MKILKHLLTIMKHRKEVRKLCFKCGLYKQGLLHDLSKYSYVEFSEGVKYYDGTKSPTAICRKKTGKSDAWLHNIKKNKHHPEYWNNISNGLMPYNYAIESICDRIAACKTYNKEKYTNNNPLEYWNQQKKKGYKINKTIEKFYDIVLSDLSKYGEKKIIDIKYLKDTYNEISKDNDLQ